MLMRDMTCITRRVYCYPSVVLGLLWAADLVWPWFILVGSGWSSNT